MNTPEYTGPVPRKGMSNHKKIGIGCGIAIIVLICAATILSCAGTGYFLYNLRDSEMLDIEVNHPETVRVGDNFELTLYLKNNGKEDIKVQNINLTPARWENYDSILVGATVTGTEPDMDNDEIPVMRLRGYLYDRVVKPGETNAVTFYLRAAKAGEFHTDVFVDTGDTLTAVWDDVISITP